MTILVFPGPLRVRQFLRSVGLPPEPFAPDLHALSGKERRLRLCHGDLQRPNILGDGRHFHVIDWELAVWGDPVWDVAARLHRAGYPPGQESEAMAALVDTIPKWAGTAADRQDYAAYLRIEQYRSLVLDALRHLRSGAAWSEGRRRAAILEYRRKLTAAELEGPTVDLMELHTAYWARDSTASPT